MKQPKSLKSRLIIYFTAATVILSIAINIFYYSTTKESLKKNMLDNASNNISYIIDNIEKQLKLSGKLSDWLFMNRTLEKVLTMDYSEVEDPYDRDIDAVIDMLDDQLMSSPIGSYISSLLIISDKGVDIRTGIDANMIDKEAIQKTSWFKNGMDKLGKVYWGSIIENPSIYKSDNYILPLVRPIIHTVYSYEIGWCMIGFRETLISDVFKNFNAGKNDIIYVIDSNGVLISRLNSDNIGKSILEQEHIKKILQQERGYFDSVIDGKKKLVIFEKFRSTDWLIVEELSYEALNDQNMVLLNITLLVLGISILVSLALTIFLSLNLTNPLRRLMIQMRKISGGDFTREASLESPDEIGELGKGINEMASNIKELLDLALKEEDEKRQLELKLLQSQVNPHFLYNTLNSIKWMAMVQKADGIRNAVSALGRMLKNIAKGTSDKITLKEELNLLEDYIFIQNIRYGGRIKQEKIFESEELLECRIVKFTLQPIIENAIFHGIEPKKDAGNIKISVSGEQEVLLISIEDDGVGMSDAQIENMFSDKESEKTRGFSGIGIKNVDDRIKLTYGKAYGLDILSEEGSYTRVNIRIPLEM